MHVFLHFSCWNFLTFLCQHLQLRNSLASASTVAGVYNAKYVTAMPLYRIEAEYNRVGINISRQTMANWVMIDIISGAKASAIAYSIAETAKANNLKPYEYFKYLLSVIPEHLDDTDRSFMDKLLPWSDKLPSECRKLAK